VLRTACEQYKTWQDAGLPSARISVNLSARQFQEPSLIQTVRRILQQSGLDSAYLELEITESILMAQQLSLRVIAEGVENRGQLNFLRACGCHEVQGYFGSNPLPGGEFNKFLQRDHFLPTLAAAT
jgi:EAL domain-containing protein (putative c-di-GMP-specific phosphodiesterase class I)